jgi:hypothetical protein
VRRAILATVRPLGPGGGWGGLGAVLRAGGGEVRGSGFGGFVVNELEPGLASGFLFSFWLLELELQVAGS